MPSDAAENHTLQLRGELTIRTAAETHRILSNSCREAQKIAIDLGAAGDTDLTLVQMILAARRSAQAAGKTVCLLAPPPEAIQRDLMRGGFLTQNDSAFWSAKE